MQKIIFDTDIGVDDAFALACAARSVEVLGITTVFGNVAVEQAVKNARLFSQKLGLNVPIFRGSSRPLACAPTPTAWQVHGEDGLGGVFTNPNSGDADSAIAFIVNTLRQSQEAITLVAIGPLTNIAVAINLAPDIVPKIAQLVIMGGAFGTHGHGGNVTPFAEFNIWKDPHAADQVLSSSLKVVMLPLDVTQQVQISGEEIRSLNRPELEAISRGYLRYSQEKNGLEGMALHDTLTLCWLSRPELFGVTASPVRVVTEGIARGQTLRRTHPLASFDDPFAGAGMQQLCLEVDSEGVKAWFLALLRDAARPDARSTQATTGTK